MDTNSNWLTDVLGNLKADPKKTGALTVLVVVLAVMVGRMVMKNKGAPQSAVAAAVNSNINPPAAGTAQANAGGDAHAQDVIFALQAWNDRPVAPVSRNLFAVRIENFPMDSSRTTKTATADEGFWAKLEKSLAVQADRIDKRENLVANFTALASKLRLESIMMGAQPRAMVNGMLVGEGSVVADFRVLKIESRRIFVEREGITLVIQMK